MSIGPPILRYSYFKIWPWKSMVKVMCVVKGQGHVWPSKFKGQGYGQVQTHWSHLRPGVQLICLLYVSWQSDHFWLRYRKFHIRPWKFNVKVMAKVKPDGHIWALEFYRYVCFSFRGNGTIFGWDIANSIFDLEKSRSRSQRKSAKIWSGNEQVRANNCAKNERNPKNCSKVIAWTRICGRRRRRHTNRYKNIKSPPVYWGDLIIIASPVHRASGLLWRLIPFCWWYRRWLHHSWWCYPSAVSSPWMTAGKTTPAQIHILQKSHSVGEALSSQTSPGWKE